MSAKPSKVPVWGTDGLNNTEPSAGKKALGWVRGEKPASSYLQWTQRLTGDWLQYLSDGAFTGNHTITGDLAVTGTITGGQSEREINLSGVDFEFDSQADPLTDTLNHPGLYRHNAGGAGYALTRSLPVKVGDVITLCTVFYAPTGGGNMQPKLKRIKLSDGTVNDVWAGIADNTGASAPQSSGAITHTVLAGEAYFVEVLVTGAANRVHGATIKYTRPA